MEHINPKDIKTQIDSWYQLASHGHVYEINQQAVDDATNIVSRLQPTTEDDIILLLCALNLLNAAIKTEQFNKSTSYEFIKGHAAKLVGIIDELKIANILYYYEKAERCLYFQFGSVVFSFHQVPLNIEILKASLSQPIKWQKIRLQKIAQPLFDYLKVQETC